ncbi:MAG TPA: DUF1641 domain-containing protein [Candidatus Sulfomarinibacteraceae bacterium]|nr:DUF1641 domain-containing protein [Candidatus Sulfomarinibacteraceae bacterium]
MSTTTIEVSADLASKLEQACDRIERLEERLMPLLELKEDLQPILNEAFRNLIVELDELDGHFRAEDALQLGKRLLRDTRRLTGMLERLEQLDELVMDLTPVVNEAAKAAIVELGEMERQGLFELALAIRGLATRFASSHRADEVMELGDRLMGLLQVAGTLGSPSSLKLLEAAAGGLGDAPRQAPGLLGLARLARDPDARRGLATLLEVCRRLGRAAAPSDGVALSPTG